MASKGAASAAVSATPTIVTINDKKHNEYATIYFYDHELKTEEGEPWKPSRRKWVTIETMLKKLDNFGYPVYFIHCRTNDTLKDEGFKNRNQETYDNKPPIDPFVERLSLVDGKIISEMVRVKDVKPYLFCETHGKERDIAINYNSIPKDFKHTNADGTTSKNFYFRAMIGKKCTKLGPQLTYIPYDYAMSCMMLGGGRDTMPTNDLLMVETMNIVVRYYDTNCISNFVTRSKSSAGANSNWSSSLVRYRANPPNVRRQNTNRWTYRRRSKSRSRNRNRP